MTRTLVRNCLVFVLTTLVSLVVSNPLAGVERQPKDCLQGERESSVNQQRRRESVRALRSLSTLQFAAKKAGGRFETEKEIRSKLPAIEGFDLELAATEDRYVAILSDHLDPCGFAVVVSDRGLIYSATPLQ